MQSKTVFIEAQRLFRKKKHGMDIVALELLRRLDNSKLTIEVLVKEDEDHCLGRGNNLSVVKLRKMFYPLWEQLLLPGYTSGKAGVLHCTANTAPVFGKLPLIVTIHDLIYLETNTLLKKESGSLYQRFGNYYRRLIVPFIARKAAHIITVSEYQRKIIIERLNIDPSKISVIYNGANEQFFAGARHSAIKDVIRKYGIGFPYIFFLANTEPRKNTAGVIKAFALFCAKHPELRHKLVIKGLTSEQLNKRIQECGAGDFAYRIQSVGYIDHADLPMMYQGADVLWFPSFSEGFGLPVIEAMAGGTPVITSNTSAMPEIAGDAALYVNPYEPSELVAQTVSLFTNNKLRNELITRGKQRALQFTWGNSAKQLIDVYEKVLQQSTTKGVSYADKLALISPMLAKKVC